MEAISKDAAAPVGADTLIIRHVLVATDLTPITHVALDLALDLAGRTGADVELMSVLGPLEGDAYSPLRYSPEASASHESAEKLIKREMEELCAQHDAGDVTLNAVVRKGRPIPTIVARAEQSDADLLVVGTHQRGLLRQFMIRSAAEEVVRKASCPVLVVHEQDEPPARQPERILVPVDLSEHSFDTLRYAESLSEIYGARLEILHVVEPAALLGTFPGALTADEVIPIVRRGMQDGLQKLLDQLELRRSELDVHVAEGHAAAQILAEADRQHSSMIVIGKQGRSSIARFLMGSVTERVIRHASCPVLVVPSDATQKKSNDNAGAGGRGYLEASPE